jgi:heavy metal sensor kinase
VFGFTRTIRFKLTLWFVGVLALVILTISAVLYFGLQRVLLQSIDANLRTVGLRSVSPVSPTGSNEKRDEEELRQLFLMSNTPARLLALDGTPLQTDPLFPTSISLTQEMLISVNGGDARFETISVGARTYRVYTAPVRMNETRSAIVQVADPLDEQLRTLADLRSVLLWLIPLSLVFAGFGGSFLAGRALAPMTRVRSDVEQIIEQTDLSRRVSSGLPDDEVGRLARTFDELLERMEQTMQRERQFSSDASHELRTPLTVLKGEISVALSRPRQAGDYRDTLQRLESTVDDMIHLVEDLLALTRAGSKQLMDAAPVALGELLTQLCERMQVIGRQKGIRLQAPVITQDVTVTGDRLKLQRVFTNLVDNALHYTARGGRVEVSLRQQDGQAHVDVRDTGRGIAPENLPRLFQRFYRADSARARASGGTGLGLAIAQTIIAMHGGKISVESAPGRGSCFTVALPITSPQALPDHVDPIVVSAPVLAAVDPEQTPPQVTQTLNDEPAALHDRAFRAMNTSITLFVLSNNARCAKAVLDAAEWFFQQTEWRLSRFRETSELSKLNREGHIVASHVMFEVVQLAVKACQDTKGIFNPLVGRAVAAAGYDRTFDEVKEQIVVRNSPAPQVPALCDALELDPQTHSITLHGDAQLDLGGIAKGWAIDRAFRVLSRLGPCCINAGGDVRVSSSYEPGGEGWSVEIADPFAADGQQAETVRSVMLRDAAIATSGILTRRWFTNGEEQHHLIDPRSGQPARNDLLFVTAIADDAMTAEIAAKTIYILGEDAGSAWAATRRVPALFMHRDGIATVNEWFMLQP